jgi:hypothetical protein
MRIARFWGRLAWLGRTSRQFLPERFDTESTAGAGTIASLFERAACFTPRAQQAAPLRTHTRGICGRLVYRAGYFVLFRLRGSSVVGFWAKDLAVQDCGNGADEVLGRLGFEQAAIGAG